MKNRFSPNLQRGTIVYLLFLSLAGHSQVSIGTLSPDPSAILELESDSLGFLLPHMNQIQRDAISSPAEGLLVYCTDCVESIQMYSSVDGWVDVNTELSESQVQAYIQKLISQDNTLLSTSADSLVSQRAIKTYVDNQILTDGADDLGNHEASQNIELGDHWISHSGNNRGILINNQGALEVVTDDADALVLNSSDIKEGRIRIESWHHANFAEIIHLFDSLATSPTGENSALRFHMEDDLGYSWDALRLSRTGLSHGNTYLGRLNDTNNLWINGFLNLQEGTGINEISTDANFSRNSDSALSTQRAIKTYVDSKLTTITLNGSDDMGSHIATQNIMLDNSYLSNDGDNEGLQIMNTGDAVFSDNLNINGSLGAEHGVSINEISTDASFSGNSDSILPTQKAIKAYVDDNTGFLERFGTFNYFANSQSFIYKYDPLANLTMNIALGANSMQFLRIGSFNVALGAFAGQLLSEGSDNIMLGPSAFNKGKSGSDNIAIGRSALDWVDTSFYNIAIGTHAGFGSHGNRNVMIGNSAGKNNDGDDRLYIENSTSDTPLISGSFALDKVGINFSAEDLDDTSATLQVGGSFAVQHGVGINEISADVSFSADSDSILPTQKAIKTYVSTEISNGGDNMGNHLATQNVQLSNNYLSNDGDNEGLQISNTGDATFTHNLGIQGNLSVEHGTSINEISADGAFAENSDSILATQAAIKFYVDSKLNTIIINGTDNMGNHLAIQNVELGSNYLSNDGDNEGLQISNTGDGTFSHDLGIQGSLGLEHGVSVNDISNDVTLGNDSDTILPTQHAVKTYVNNQILTGGADDLGNHTASQSISLSDNLINNDGSSTEGIAITDTGWVGINIKDSDWNAKITSALDVNGNIHIRQDHQNDGAYFRSLGHTHTEMAALEFYYSRLDTSYARIVSMNYNNFGWGWYNNFDRMDAGLSFFSSNNGESIESMTIDNLGNVGIGRVPDTKLSVNGAMILEHGVGVNEISTDVNFSENSDSILPTQKAIKTYVDDKTTLSNGDGTVIQGSSVNLGGITNNDIEINGNLKGLSLGWNPSQSSNSFDSIRMGSSTGLLLNAGDHVAGDHAVFELQPTEQYFGIKYTNDELKGIHMVNDKILIIDEKHNRGLAYADDYQSGIGQYGDRWIPDRGYVDWKVASGGASDIRLKENLEKVEGPLAKINALTGYSYNFIKDHDSVRTYGVIAQDVAKVLPELITTIDKENHMGVVYNGLIPILVEGIKVQQNQILDKTKQIKSLREELQKQQNQIEALQENERKKGKEMTELQAQLDRIEKHLSQDGFGSSNPSSTAMKE